MTLFDSYSVLAVEGTGFDPTTGIAVIAGVTLLLATAFMLFVAIAPYLSPKWAGAFGTEPSEREYEDDDEGDAGGVTE